MADSSVDRANSKQLGGGPTGYVFMHSWLKFWCQVEYNLYRIWSK